MISILRLIFLMTSSLSIVGCATMLEFTMGHRANAVVQNVYKANSEVIHRCAIDTITTLRTRDGHVSYGWWKDRPSIIDKKMGVVDIGDYSSSNIAGIRTKILIEEDSYRIYVKATGPYYMDLGAEKALKDLQTGLESCVEKTYQIASSEQDHAQSVPLLFPSAALR